MEQETTIRKSGQVVKKKGATKYTEKFVLSELEAMMNEVLENKEIVFIGELFLDRDYSMQRFSEWAENFKEHSVISETIKRIRDALETRINIGGLTGKLNPTMTIFNLKNNYNWKDKRESEVTGELNLVQSVKDILGKADGGSWGLPKK